MKILKPSFEYLDFRSEKELAKTIEQVGRTCYQSADGITDDSCIRFVKRMISSGHEAMIEHASITVRITCDRGISHEIVRHRVGSFGQESTRYCNYAKDKFTNSVSFIDIATGIQLDKSMQNLSAEQLDAIMQEWLAACEDSERHYLKMIELGASPQIARSVLINSTKTAICCTFNIREWRHFFKLRAIGVTGAPHPQMVEIAKIMLDDFAEKYPSMFADLLEG